MSARGILIAPADDLDMIYLRAHDSISSPVQEFLPVTQWTLVVKASGDEATEAWADIFTAYWYPLYAFVRRSGHRVHDAEDITQGFFHELISKDCLANADPDIGKLRSYLLAMLKNYMASEWRKAQAAKRGGGQAIFSLDVHHAEQQILAARSNEPSAELDYDRKWASTLFHNALAELRESIVKRYDKNVCDAILTYLVHQAVRVDYQKLEDKLGISKSNLRILIHRRRMEFRTLLRKRVAATLLDDDDIDEEMSYVLGLLAR